MNGHNTVLQFSWRTVLFRLDMVIKSVTCDFSAVRMRSMKIFGINLISVLIAGTFTLPVLMGILRPFSKNRIQYSLISMVHNIELIVSIVSSVLLTNIIFTSSADSFPTKIFKYVPAIWHTIAYQDICSYALATII